MTDDDDALPPIEDRTVDGPPLGPPPDAPLDPPLDPPVDPPLDPPLDRRPPADGPRTPGDQDVGRGRVALVVLGVAALGFGAQQLLTGGNSTRLTSSVPWLVSVLVLHDAVFAPLSVVAGWSLVRLLRRRLARAVPVVAIGAYLAVVLAVLALPALLSPGVSDNPTSVPRDYGHALWVLLAVDAVATVLLSALAATGIGRPAPTPADRDLLPDPTS
jgi:hypothetical protein